MFDNAASGPAELLLQWVHLNFPQ